MTTDTGRLAESFFNDRYAIDQATAADLLAVAMSRGGEHADGESGREAGRR